MFVALITGFGMLNLRNSGFLPEILYFLLDIVSLKDLTIRMLPNGSVALI